MKTLIVIGMWIVGAIMIAIMQKVAPENNDWYPVWVIFVCTVYLKFSNLVIERRKADGREKMDEIRNSR